MVIVLTRTDWKALQRILSKINAQTRSGSSCAILAHPKAATIYRERTGRDITDHDNYSINHSFDPPDYTLDLIDPDQVQFAERGSKVIHEKAAACLPAILESIGLGPDGITEVPHGE
jgi:hypothetical protein